MISKINHILPTLFALILPGLGIYSYSNPEQKDVVDIAISWLIGSVCLYAFWHLLWRLWDIRPATKRISLTAGLVSALITFFWVVFPDFFEASRGVFLPPVVRMLLLSSLFMVIQYALRTQQHVAELLLEKEQLQTESYKSQLKSLQAKVDPHFLFNSLNTLRSMVRQGNQNSEKFIISLSDFYRQTLKYNENTMLELSEELTVLQSYLFLMKSRNEEAVLVDWKIDSSYYYFKIPTLALQTILENCFKHNSMSSKKPLYISIKGVEKCYIEVSNNIQPKFGEEESSGLGLELLKKRYELLGVEDGVNIHQTPDEFTVRLKLHSDAT